MISIEIGNKKYNVKEAKTEEELETGLKGVKELPNDEGMLFYMDEEDNVVTFTMSGMDIPLDIVFINLDQEVTSVAENCQPGVRTVKGGTTSEGDYIAYVLEVNPNSGIKKGDTIDFDEKLPVMKVLAQDGSTLMELWGGERIISRRETKVLIKKAKKAEETQKESDIKTLGRYMFKVLKGQDTRDAEYVQAPE